MKKQIVVLPGDGIGNEIMEAALEVYQKIISKLTNQYEFTFYDFGGISIDNFGQPLTNQVLTACKASDGILLGAIGGEKWRHTAVTPESGLLTLRKELKLFANIRPIQVPQATVEFSPLKKEIVTDVDLVVVRELTGGIYFGEPRLLTDECAIDTCVYQKHEIQRIMEVAFKLAETRRGKVTSVDKANVLSTSKLWRQIAEETALKYPKVRLEHQLVDSAAMKLIHNPKSFDVIVTENMFGDILSDEASMIPGTLGVLPSASQGESGPSLYEPIHGSAPDIAGKNIANPTSMMLSMAMMFRQSFHEEIAANLIEKACFMTIESGIITTDLGGNATTTQFTKHVIDNIEKLIFKGETF